jgi:hypothetical protein
MKGTCFFFLFLFLAASRKDMAVSNQGDDVSKFFIFDTRLGQREENEHEKILFYYPASATLDQQQSDVGLCVNVQCLTKMNFSLP